MKLASKRCYVWTIFAVATFRFRSTEGFPPAYRSSSASP